jgi:precorrin-6B methylase 2
MRSKTLAVILSLAVSVFPLFAAATAEGGRQFQPNIGQAGKDVIWVPTPEGLVTAMLDMAKVTPGDYVIDLGSGDGRIVIAAAKRGARAMGVEFNPDMVALSRQNAQKEGVADRASFVQADIFETDFSKATVVTMYLLTQLNLKLRPQILDLKPGTRVVSHAFNMEDWEADQTASSEERTAYLWIVPAKVAGTWTWTTSSGGAELVLNQVYQKIEGTLKIGGREQQLQNAKLTGDLISFTVSTGPSSNHAYSGRVIANGISGTIKSADGAGTKWTAARRPVP